MPVYGSLHLQKANHMVQECLFRNSLETCTPARGLGREATALFPGPELGAIWSLKTYSLFDLFWSHHHTYTTFPLEVFSINGIQGMTPHILKGS